MSLTIELVRTRAQLHRFIILPRQLYQGMSGYVPPLDQERRELLEPKKNPFFTHGHAAYWIASRRGRLVGRISAQIDLLAIGPAPSEIGLFGCLDTIDDGEVVAELLRTAESWLRERSRRLIRGPFLLSINGEPGLLIDGHAEPPVTLLPWHPPYLEKHLRKANYVQATRLFCYLLDFTGSPFHERVRRLGEIRAHHAITIRNFRLDHLDADSETGRQIVNDGWRRNWGFTPVSESDVLGLLQNFRPFLFPDSGFFVEHLGEPAAFVLSIPNLFEITADLGGSPSLVGWLKLLFRVWRQRYRCFRVVLIGMASRYHGTVLGARISAAALEELRRRMRRRGVDTLVAGWVVESNKPMIRVIESLGFRYSRTYGLYEKPLVEDPRIRPREIPAGDQARPFGGERVLLPR
jgi:GNAT superfamily N-acetyltransferase